MNFCDPESVELSGWRELCLCSLRFTGWEHQFMISRIKMSLSNNIRQQSLHCNAMRTMSTLTHWAVIVSKQLTLVGLILLWSVFLVNVPSIAYHAP